jgi:hypothetical protein
MAQFNNELMQKPTRIVCPVCNISWSGNVPQATLNTHVMQNHPSAWLDWVGWLKDQKELNGIYALQDVR